jgi:L-asparaginase
MKRILFLATGGTIASRQKGSQGLAPQISARELLEYLGELPNKPRICPKDLFYLDSGNIQGAQWQIIAREVAGEISRFDGVVITHGTDTLAYTASMLSFMLQNLDKPVVLTGAQIPIEHPWSDAKENLIMAMEAVEKGVPGVLVAFGRKLIRGCRSVKTSVWGLDAFESVNAPYIGEAEASGLRVHDLGKGGIRGGALALKDGFCPNVFLLKLIPGLNPDICEMLPQMGYRGLVVEAFGAGGTPFMPQDLSLALKILVESGMPVVIRSQCLYGASDLSLYETGLRLLDSGVIPGRDMTGEAAVTKLMWALGQGGGLDQARRAFDVNYAGEVTLG